MRTPKLALLAFALLLGSGWLPAQDKEYHDPGIGKIVQIAIVCEDIEKCAQNWSKLLNQPAPPIRTTRPGREVKVVYRGDPSDGQVKLTFFKTGDAVLELMEPVGQDTHWREHLDKYGEGVHHIAFQVENLEKTIASFERQGMGVAHRGRYDSDNGTYVYLDTMERLGVTIELLHSDKQK